MMGMRYADVNSHILKMGLKLIEKKNVRNTLRIDLDRNVRPCMRMDLPDPRRLDQRLFRRKTHRQRRIRVLFFKTVVDLFLRKYPLQEFIAVLQMAFLNPFDLDNIGSNSQYHRLLI